LATGLQKILISAYNADKISGISSWVKLPVLKLARRYFLGDPAATISFNGWAVQNWNATGYLAGRNLPFATTSGCLIHKIVVLKPSNTQFPASDYQLIT